MDLELHFLETLKRSRPAYDAKPDWRDALAEYSRLTPARQAELGQTLLRMIDEDYRNPHSSREDLPFDDAMVALPAGVAPDDLLCVEAAVMVAAAIPIGAAFFALNRLLRAPLWHALTPRLIWLPYEASGAQRTLSLTRAGRTLGALLGAALGDSLRPGEDGLDVGETGTRIAAMVSLAHQVAQSKASRAAAPADAVLEIPPGLAFPPKTPLQHALSHLLDGGPKSGLHSEPAEVALLCATDTLEECVTQAMNTGQNVLLAGALAGACYGPLALPRRWSMKLQDRAGLEASAEALYAVWDR